MIVWVPCGLLISDWCRYQLIYIYGGNIGIILEIWEIYQVSKQKSLIKPNFLHQTYQWWRDFLKVCCSKSQEGAIVISASLRVETCWFKLYSIYYWRCDHWPQQYSATSQSEMDTVRLVRSRHILISWNGHCPWVTPGPIPTSLPGNRETRPVYRRCTWCPADASSHPSGICTWCRRSCGRLPSSPRRSHRGALVYLQHKHRHTQTQHS